MDELPAYKAPSPGRVALIVLLSWLSMVGFDFLLHAGLLARLYIKESPFLLPPADAFRLIPLGYLSFLILAGLLLYLLLKTRVSGAWPAARFGLILGALIWGAFALGMASITTAEPSLLLAWFIGQAVELGIGGWVAGSALSGARLGRLALKVGGFVLACIIIAVALQSLGLAPMPDIQ